MIMRRAAIIAGLGAALGAAPALALELPAGADPVLVDIVHACSATLAGGAGEIGEELAAAGWSATPLASDSQAYAGHSETAGQKFVEGIGAILLAASQSRYGDVALGNCSARIEPVGRPLELDSLAFIAGMTGGVSIGPQVSEGAWRQAGERPTLFIRIGQMADPAVFQFNLTQIAEPDAGKSGISP